MGDGPCKTGELPNTVSGLKENEKNLIESTWRDFCSNNHEYGLLHFLSLFVRHPEYLPMFRDFRAKHPALSAHGCVIGYHLTSMVDNILDLATFEVLVRHNATQHFRRHGVRQRHFEVIVIDVLQAEEKRLMTLTTVCAWEKFLSVSILRL
ncbi:hemoglobin-3-like [Rhipicephalus microplus]|uniref:hemoglobin-3-like n=1 Tax=Rhipicephalus microplus TaxID=6941 RepID=UPI003F6A8A87